MPEKYDQNIEQRVTTLIKGKKVTHVFHPITDQGLLEFIERRDQLEEDEALALFYDLMVDRLEGIVGDLPADWKTRLPASEKVDVARKTCLHCQFLDESEEEVVRDEDGFSFDDYLAIDRNQRTYKLQTYFNGEKLTVPVTLRLFTAKERKDLVRVLPKEGASEKFKMEFSANVARDAIIGDAGLPVVLLAALALHHLTSDSLVMEKNSAG